MNKLIVMLWIGLVGLVSCNAKPDAEKDHDQLITSQSIDSKTAKIILEQQEDIVLIDVRTAEEFALGHLSGAKNIDFNQPDFEERLKALDTDQKYMLYCAVGGRSGKALKIMENIGFKTVYNVTEGEGFKQLREQGIPIQQGDN